MIQRHVAYLLRRHVGRRTDARYLGARLLSAVHHGRAEVGDLDVAAGTFGAIPRVYQQDVCRLDVAMRNAGAKGIVERAGAFEDHLYQAVYRQQRARAAERLQCAARHVLHDNVALLLGQYGIENLHDVGMHEFSGQRSFGHQQIAVDPAAILVAQNLREDGLDRDFALGEGIEAEVDDRGGAFAELLADLVLADAFWNHHRSVIRAGRGNGQSRP